MAKFTFPTSVDEIEPDMARFLFENGATLIFLDFPVGSEFGIDYKSWTVGEKFKGLKMIPPGVHFVYFSIKKAPRIGFFHCFRQKEIVLKKWDPKIEDLVQEEVDPEKRADLERNLRSMDPFLGPYPFDTYRCWFSLSNHINQSLVSSLSPSLAGGRISAQAELVSAETELREAGGDFDSGEMSFNTSNTVDREHPSRLRFVDKQGLPIMRVRPGYDLRFHKIPQRPATNEVGLRTRTGMDTSDQLEQLLAKFADSSEVLGEMQFAFVCFLMGQVYEGFEHWKRLVHLFSNCSKALTNRSQLFLDFITAIHFQLKECPEDFFVDIVSRDNFLTATLSRLFSNIELTENADQQLKLKAGKFKKYLTKRFKWDFESEEDRPAVVTS